MAEWSKARDSKSRRPQKGLEGSNPSPTAILAYTHSFKNEQDPGVYFDKKLH